MLIKEEALKYWIENFYGYGSWQARIWFVGYEENGGDDPEEVADKINYFKNIQPGALCDIRELYRHVAFRGDGPKASLYAHFHDYRFGADAVQHGYWKNLIAFAHGYSNRQLPDLLAYQKKHFVSPSANSEALLQLYPLPAHNHAWYYGWLDLPQMHFLKRRLSYQEHLYRGRMQHILQNMSRCKPEVVVMYGMDNINLLKESVYDFFSGTKFKMVKAISRQIPQHHYAEVNGTRLLITTQIPALRHNRIETGFDWYAFGQTLK